jgi:hypothetical protein
MTGQKRHEDKKLEELKMAIEPDLIGGYGGLSPHTPSAGAMGG